MNTDPANNEQALRLSLGHTFDDSLICQFCNQSYEDHQFERALCPKSTKLSRKDWLRYATIKRREHPLPEPGGG